MPSKSTTDSLNSGDGRPTKRRRFEMPSPDGFITNAVPKPVHKATVPRFLSAFGDGDAKRQPSASDSKSFSKTVKPRLHHTSSCISSSKGDVNGTRAEADPSNLKPRSTREKPLVSVKDIQKSISLDSPTRDKTAPQLRPAPPPPRPPSASSSTSAPAVSLKQILPPAFPSAKPPSKALKPLQQPPIPAPRKASVSKDLRTISTTGLGRLNDLSSENGAEELASILLRDQHPEIAHVESGHDAIMHRGLGLSPEKKGKGSNSKFIRGGLAAHASAYFDRTHTSLILWQKEIEHRANPPSSDLLASIIKVLHKPLPSRYVPSSPGVALCRIRQQNGSAHGSFEPNYLYRIIFSFSHANSPEKFTEGQTVRVYKPWQEISFRLDETKLEPTPPRLPASLPLPSSEPFSSPDILDARINDKALVCSRFLISS